MAAAAVAQWQPYPCAVGQHEPAYEPVDQCAEHHSHHYHEQPQEQEPSHHDLSPAEAAAAAQAQAAAEAHAEAQRRSEEQRMFIVSQPISQPSDEPLDETGKSTKPANPNEFDPFYGRRVISELCERVIASLFECSLDSTAASMGAKGIEQRPTHRLSEFIAYALYRTRLPIQVTYQALYLLKRLKSRYPGARGSSGHRLFISALMLASKSTCDDTYSNKSWTIVGQGLFTLREVNQMERELFSYLGYRVNVANEALANFIDGLETGRFISTADLLNCNASIPLAQVEALAAAANADHGELCGASDYSIHEDDVKTSEDVKEGDALPSNAQANVSCDVGPEQAAPVEPSSAQPQRQAYAEPAPASSSAFEAPSAAALERSSSVYVPRSRSAPSFQMHQRASIAGYPLPTYAAGSMSMSMPGLPSYLQTNSAPATCAAPLRSIAGGAATFDSRPSSAHSHFRILQSARERSRPYTMPQQTASLHPHPYTQPFFPSEHAEHSHSRLSSSVASGNDVGAPYYAAEYLNPAHSHSRSPSGRSTASSFSSSGSSSYASSEASNSTSPSLYESRSQSSGFTTPETTDMELAYSPSGECETMVGSQTLPSPFGGKGGMAECYIGGTGGKGVDAAAAASAPLEWLRSQAAIAAMQRKEGQYVPNGAACYPGAAR